MSSTSSTYSEEFHLNEQIDEALEKTSYENNHSQKFLPDDKLAAILTIEGVKSALDSDYTPQVYNFVKNQASKVFAILVHTGQAKAILDFQKYKIHDAYLPIALKAMPTIGGRKKRYELVSVSSSEIPAYNLALGNLWGGRDCAWTQNAGQFVRWFCEKQWTFLAPEFSETSPHRCFLSETVMPFYRPDGEKPSEKPSTFSTVYKTWIYPSHQKFQFQVCNPYLMQTLHLFPFSSEHGLSLALLRCMC